MLKEFKDFIARGNVIDLAVGVIIGGAFGEIVSSLVNDILMPIFGVTMGGLDFNSLVLKIGNAKICYGAFIQNIIEFLIIAVSLFFIVVLLNRLSRIFRKQQSEEPVEQETELAVLKEIRNELKKKKN